MKNNNFKIVLELTDLKALHDSPDSNLKRVIFSFIGLYNSMFAVIIMSFATHTKTKRILNQDKYYIWAYSPIEIPQFSCHHLTIHTDRRTIQKIDKDSSIVPISPNNKIYTLSQIEARQKLRILERLKEINSISDIPPKAANYANESSNIDIFSPNR